MATTDNSGQDASPAPDRQAEWYEIVWNDRAARRGLITFVVTVLGLALYLAVTGKGDLAAGLLVFGLFLAAIRGWRELRSLWRWALRHLATLGDDQ